MPYEFYKILHFLGIFATLMGLGGIGAHILSGGNRETFKARKWLGMLHGMGLVLILIAGFGLHVRVLPGEAFQGWQYAKLVIWLLLGIMPALFYRQPRLAKSTWWLTLGLASAAAMLAIFKPF